MNYIIKENKMGFHYNFEGRLYLSQKHNNAEAVKNSLLNSIQEKFRHINKGDFLDEDLPSTYVKWILSNDKEYFYLDSDIGFNSIDIFVDWIHWLNVHVFDLDVMEYNGTIECIPNDGSREAEAIIKITKGIPTVVDEDGNSKSPTSHIKTPVEENEINRDNSIEDETDKKKSKRFFPDNDYPFFIFSQIITRLNFGSAGLSLKEETYREAYPQIKEIYNQYCQSKYREQKPMYDAMKCFVENHYENKWLEAWLSQGDERLGSDLSDEQFLALLRRLELTLVKHLLPNNVYVYLLKDNNEDNRDFELEKDIFYTTRWIDEADKDAIPEEVKEAIVDRLLEIIDGDDDFFQLSHNTDTN